jgi:hypothetical protein
MKIRMKPISAIIENGEGHGNVSTAKINGYHGGGLPPGESLKRGKK